MRAVSTTSLPADLSPRAKARLAGALYLFTILAGAFAQGYISERLVVPGDAAATVANLLAHQGLFQLSFSVYLVEMASQILMTILFYELLKPVSKTVSLVAAVIGLSGCVIKTLSRLFYIAPLLVLGGPHFLSVFNPAQREALVLLSFQVNDLGAGIAMAFFGLAALAKGYLIVRSTFLPRVLGVLSVVAGLSLLAFLSPTLGPRLFSYLVVLGLVGAVPQILWLLVFGVNDQRWRQQAAAARTSIWA